ncbi:MAG: hypothetical protein WD226_09120 [Planctomycetota bacterium]
MSSESPEVPSREQREGPIDKTQAAGEPAKRADATPLAEKIGFAKLDLTVEEVEERISPRETNVFDK